MIAGATGIGDVVVFCGPPGACERAAVLADTVGLELLPEKCCEFVVLGLSLKLWLRMHSLRLLVWRRHKWDTRRDGGGPAAAEVIEEASLNFQ